MYSVKEICDKVVFKRRVLKVEMVSLLAISLLERADNFLAKLSRVLCYPLVISFLECDAETFGEGDDALHIIINVLIFS
jgi:hypothetical protein